METSFRTYPAEPSAIVFEQFFPTALGEDMGLYAHRRGDNFDSCRIVTGKFSLTKSTSGYEAYTKANSTSMEYDEHKGMYCDSNHKWAYTANLNEKQCQAKCLELDCECFDVGGKAPSPSPSHELAARTIFPAFDRGGGLTSDSLDAFAYHGVFPGLKKTTMGEYKQSHQGGVPLVIYDSKNATLPNLIFSPLNLPKAHHMATTDDFIGAGVKATGRYM